MKRKKNKIQTYAIAIAVIAIIVLIVGKKQGWLGENFGIKVAAETVKRRTITEVITANGKIQPETEVKISPDVSGEIIELDVKEGDEVTRGQLLVIIKPDTYEQAVNRNEASLSSSKARLAQAEAKQVESELAFSRSKTLYQQKAIAQSDFESAEAAYKVALAEVKAAEFSVRSAEASVEEAREELVKTKIYAPMNGTVSKLNVEKGERVVGTNMYAGTEIMVIADLTRMEVKVDVNENDIVKVSRSDTALAEVDAYMGRRFKGVVTEIANSANTTGTSTDQVTNFEVKVLLLKDSYADLIDSVKGNLYPFRPGMSATVDIQTETRTNVLTVPIQAITTRVIGKADSTALKSSGKEEKEEVAFRYADGKVYKTRVKPGIQDKDNIEILEGLNDSDAVVVAPYNAINKTLKDSMKVEKVPEKELFSPKKK